VHIDKTGQDGFPREVEFARVRRRGKGRSRANRDDAIVLDDDRR